MRILSLILAIYFFGLSVKTCRDHAAFPDNCKIVSCIHLESSHAGNNIADECSPFCTCSCCGTITFVGAIKYTFERSFTPLSKPVYSENFLSEISFSIWQPPRI